MTIRRAGNHSSPPSLVGGSRRINGIYRGASTSLENIATVASNAPVGAFDSARNMSVRQAVRRPRNASDPGASRQVRTAMPLPAGTQSTGQASTISVSSFQFTTLHEAKTQLQNIKQEKAAVSDQLVKFSERLSPLKAQIATKMEIIWNNSVALKQNADRLSLEDIASLTNESDKLTAEVKYDQYMRRAFERDIAECVAKLDSLTLAQNMLQEEIQQMSSSSAQLLAYSSTSSASDTSSQTTGLSTVSYSQAFHDASSQAERVSLAQQKVAILADELNEISALNRNAQKAFYSSREALKQLKMRNGAYFSDPRFKLDFTDKATLRDFEQGIRLDIDIKHEQAMRTKQAVQEKVSELQSAQQELDELLTVLGATSPAEGSDENALASRFSPTFWV